METKITETEARRQMEDAAMSKRAPLPRFSPWLVYSKDKGQNFCSIMKSGATKTSRRYIPELQNKKIVACSHGWVVLRHDAGRKGMNCSLWNPVTQESISLHYSLWNPVTSESISLPPLNLRPYQFKWECLLTDPPSHKDSKIILFCYYGLSIICCWLSHKEWIEFGYSNQIRSLDNGDSDYIFEKPISCNGKIYATTSSPALLLLIELDGPNSLEVSMQTYLPRSQHRHCWRISERLVESMGEIFYISFHLDLGVKEEEITCVEVFKLDLSSMTWAKLTSAKDRAFFLGNDYATSCPVLSSDIEGSRIYFTRKKDRTLYSYNMEDQSISISLPCRDLPPPPLKARPDWIMPDFNLVNQETNREPEEVDRDVRVSARDRDSVEKKIKDREEVEKLINFPSLPWLVSNTIARSFCAVSKLCSTLTSQFFATSKPSELSSPWLIFSEVDKGIYDLVDSRRRNNRHFLKTPEFLQDSMIRCSKEGWLVVSKDLSVTLFNPLTNNTIQLPDMPEDMASYITNLSLTCSPSSPDCHIVGVAECLWSLAVTIQGENEWQEIVCEEKRDPNEFFHTSAFYKGAVYLLSQTGMLKVFDVFKNENPMNGKPFDKPIPPPCTNFHHNYLAECGGELVAVFVGKMGKSVNVYRLNFAELSWEEVTSLENYALYLSRSSSFSMQVQTPEMANRIYFPHLHNQEIVFYSLDTGKFHALGSEYPFESFYNTTLPLDCAWIELAWS